MRIYIDKSEPIRNLLSSLRWWGGEGYQIKTGRLSDFSFNSKKKNRKNKRKPVTGSTRREMIRFVSVHKCARKEIGLFFSPHKIKVTISISVLTVRSARPAFCPSCPRWPRRPAAAVAAGGASHRPIRRGPQPPPSWHPPAPSKGAPHTHSHKFTARFLGVWLLTFFFVLIIFLFWSLFRTSCCHPSRWRLLFACWFIL